MFARLFAVASLAALAVAGPAHLALRDQCSTGPVNCCNNVANANDVSNVFSHDILAAIAGVTGKVAWNCSPIDVVGVLTGNSCTSQAVCCSNTAMNGLVNAGCSPINL